MSTLTGEWTTEFTCTDCKNDIVAHVEDVVLGAFEFDDASFSHTSRKPYVHCPVCDAPRKLDAAAVPGAVLKQAQTR